MNLEQMFKEIAWEKMTFDQRQAVRLKQLEMVTKLYALKATLKATDVDEESGEWTDFCNWCYDEFTVLCSLLED